MKIRIISGAAAIALGLLIALGPQFLFKVCEPTPTLLHTSGNFMKCHWTAQAEVGVGALITALGIALMIFASPKMRLGLVIGILFSGILALLIPHVLIGGCGTDTMQCRKVAFPAITAISILLLIGASFYAVYLARKKEDGATNNRGGMAYEK